MEIFRTAFVRCVLQKNVEVKNIQQCMSTIFTDLGFRKWVPYVKISQEEACFAQVGTGAPAEGEPDLQLKLRADNYAVPPEMKWNSPEQDDQGEEDDEQSDRRRPLLTCLRFRGESAKCALSSEAANCYVWLGYVFGFNGVGRVIEAIQTWYLLHPFEFYLVEEVEGDNVFGIRTDFFCNHRVSGYERFLQLALHELCFRLHAELAAQETTVVTAKPDETTGEGKWVDLFGFKPGVPRLLWQARPDMVFVKHPNAALEAELEAHQRLVCLLAANNGSLPKF